MLRSLRFQLPALFLLGVVVAGLVSAAIALRLFQSYAQNRARAGLRPALERGEGLDQDLQEAGRAEAALCEVPRAGNRRRPDLLPRAAALPRPGERLPAAAEGCRRHRSRGGARP